MRIINMLLVSALALAASPASAAPGDEAKLKAIEVAWGKAMVKADISALERIMAPEYVFQGGGPKPQTRGQMNADLKSGKQKLESYTVRDLRVRVMGNMAYVMGYDDEKSSYDGKDTSGTYGFMDVFQRRNGRWVALATQGGKVAG